MIRVSRRRLKKWNARAVRLRLREEKRERGYHDWCCTDYLEELLSPEKMRQIEGFWKHRGVIPEKPSASLFIDGREVADVFDIRIEQTG